MAKIGFEPMTSDYEPDKLTTTLFYQKLRFPINQYLTVFQQITKQFKQIVVQV